MKFSREIKKSRQGGKPVNPEMLPENLFEKIREASENSEMEDEKRLKRVHELHRKYAGQEYVVNAVGDITDQIDEEFSYE
jgi:delta 1-pyrroline-5-carboxylate dehydrogenase